MTDKVPQLVEEGDSNQSLQRLKKPHYELMALRSLGLSNTEIAERCNKNPNYISWFFSQTIVKNTMGHLYEEEKSRLSALTKRSVDAIRDGLDPERATIDQRLKAAKLQLDTQGLTKPQENASASAEDVVQRVLNMQVNINMGDRK